MKKILFVLSLLLFGCALPLPWIRTIPSPEAVPTTTPVVVSPTVELGAEKNPLILALAPSPRPSEENLQAGEFIAAFLQKHTGYKVVSVQPSSEKVLIESFANGNAHIGVLSPLGYALARENDSVHTLFARLHNGKIFYGAQFLANRGQGFTSHYDEIRGENTAEASAALQQFQDKKACWTDECSPSGHVVPLGALRQAQVEVRSAAFLDGQVSVVRAVYAKDICDLGAGYIDARLSPALETDYADVMERVMVVWRIPEIIPYDTVAVASSMPLEIRRAVQRTLIDLMLTVEGKAALQTVYGIDQMQVVEDSAYAEFISLVQASGLALEDLIQ